MLVFQQPTVSFEILLVSRVAVGRTEAKTRVAIGAEIGFSSPQTGCRMLPGRGAPVRELMVHNPTLVQNRNRGKKEKCF